MVRYCELLYHKNEEYKGQPLYVTDLKWFKKRKQRSLNIYLFSFIKINRFITIKTLVARSDVKLDVSIFIKEVFNNFIDLFRIILQF